jgi:hypothetical protein
LAAVSDLPVIRTSEAPVGWRVWSLRFKPDSVVLQGARSIEWGSAELTAECLAFKSDDPRRVNHQCPSDPVVLDEENRVRTDTLPPNPDYHPQPGCGIYALKDDYIGDFRQSSAAAFMFPVHGFVELSGLIHQYEYGYRAAHARMLSPLTLMVPCFHGTGGYMAMFKRCFQPATEVIVATGKGGRCADHPPDRNLATMPTDEFTAPIITALQDRYQLEVRAAWHE